MVGEISRNNNQNQIEQITESWVYVQRERINRVLSQAAAIEMSIGLTSMHIVVDK